MILIVLLAGPFLSFVLFFVCVCVLSVLFFFLDSQMLCLSQWACLVFVGLDGSCGSVSSYTSQVQDALRGNIEGEAPE